MQMLQSSIADTVVWTYLIATTLCTPYGILLFASILGNSCLSYAIQQYVN